MKAKVNALLSVTITLLILTAGNAFTANTVSSQQMRDCLKNQDWQGATSQLKLLISQSPKDAASFVIDDENKELWGEKILDAVEVLKTASQSTPRDATGFKLRVALLDCYKNLEIWDQAFTLIETIASDYPDDKLSYHNFKAICYYYQNKHTEALVEIKKAAELYNGTQVDKELIGYVLQCYPYDDTNRIIRVAYTMIRYLPDCTDKQRASIYGWAWNMCMDSGCMTEANAICSKAAPCWEKVKNDGDLGTLTVLIHAYLDARDYEKAIPLCKEIAASKPENAVDALTVLAECLHALGRDQEALDYQVDYYRQHPELKLEADWTYARTKFYTEQDKSTTISLLEKLQADYPEFPHKYELQSYLYYAYKAGWKTSKLINLLKEMQNTCPEYRRAEVSTKLAEVYILVNATKAETLLNQLIKDNPDHYLVPKWKIDLANCSFSKGDLATARDAYKAVYEHYPNNKYGYNAHFAYAHCCICQGDLAVGEAVLREIVEKCPDKKSVDDAKERLSLLKKK
ncbi:tetratricopeptide repeat protein [bacterium]|nr:tetratricopeptide repeat protein [bacterium]